MKAIRWVYAASAVGMVVGGGLSEQACTSSTTLPLAGAQGSTSTTTSYSSTSSSAKPDTGVYNPGFTFKPGNGTKCASATGDFPVATCDSSDEQAANCNDGVTLITDGGVNGCTYDPKCGDITTCEPFAQNPPPETGVDNFRMRFINLTAPSVLVLVQGTIVAPAVSIPSSPDGGANCGESGTGLFNWLISVDRPNKKITTGGATPSADPFNIGYCYINGTLGGQAVAPSTIPATFTGYDFKTDVLPGVLNIPIFLAGGGVVDLPIRGASLVDVSVSSDGNCIGGVNLGANNAGQDNCQEPGGQVGPNSCSRWHASGALGGYITLEDADGVFVQTLGESLCALLTGDLMANDAGYRTCTPAGKKAGTYCAPTTDGGTGHACTNGDSVWLAAQFAASAVKVASGKGVNEYMGKDLCNGGSYP